MFICFVFVGQYLGSRDKSKEKAFFCSNLIRRKKAKKKKIGSNKCNFFGWPEKLELPINTEYPLLSIYGVN